MDCNNEAVEQLNREASISQCADKVDFVFVSCK